MTACGKCSADNVIIFLNDKYICPLSHHFQFQSLSYGYRALAKCHMNENISFIFFKIKKDFRNILKVHYKKEKGRHKVALGTVISSMT